MSKTFVGKTPESSRSDSLRPNIKSDEFFSEAINDPDLKLMDYFEIFTNHSPWPLTTSKNLFAVYTIPTESRSTPVNIIENIMFDDLCREDFEKEDVPDEVFNNCFNFDGYEIDYEGEGAIQETGEKIIRFFGLESREPIKEKSKNNPNEIIMKPNDSWMGDYYIDRNILWLADVTHTSTFWKPFLKRVINILTEKGLWQPLKKTAKEEKEKKTKPWFKVTLGCDPEFECVSKEGAPISVREYSGSDRTKIKGSSSSESIGVDGAGDQVEIRPAPSDNPQVIVKNISKLFETLKHAQFSTIGNRFPLGGHIHVGVGFNYSPSSDLLALLDYFVGKPSMELNGEARRKSSYGQPGSYETKGYGFEYRTPPAAIFHFPDIAEIFFKIVKNVCEGYFNEEKFVLEMGKSPTKDEYISYAKISEEEYERLTNFLFNFKTFVSYTNNLIPNWVNNIKFNTPEFKYRATLVFKHMWSPELKDVLNKWAEEIRVANKDIKVLLYGLKEERGANIISGFSVDGLQTLESKNKKNEENCDLIFGLPIDYRMLNMDHGILTLITEKLLTTISEKSLTI